MERIGEWLFGAVILAAIIAAGTGAIYAAAFYVPPKYDVKLPDGTNYQGAVNVHFFENRIEFTHGGRRHTAYGASASRLIDQAERE